MDLVKTKYRDEIMDMMIELESTIYEDSEIMHLHEFVTNYTDKNFDEIRFNWNKKYGKEFKDYNYKFREKLSFYIIIRYKKNDNSELLRDLFCEQSKCDKESWGASGFLFYLGERLLISARRKYIYEFLEGAMRSFDTYGCCTSIRVDNSLIDELKVEIEDLLEVASGDRIGINLLKNGIEYIENFKN